jgi:hypothetical protein
MAEACLCVPDSLRRFRVEHFVTPPLAVSIGDLRHTRRGDQATPTVTRYLHPVCPSPETRSGGGGSMYRSSIFLVAVCSMVVLLLSGCAPISSVTLGTGNGNDPRSGSASTGHRNGGPPPHAPAHGYRHKHRHQEQDLEFVFDSELGIYVVVGIPDRYYWNGYYLRIDGDQWFASVNLDSGWLPRSDDSLPSGAGKKKHRKARHGKSKKSSPAAKGGW